MKRITDAACVYLIVIALSWFYYMVVLDYFNRTVYQYGNATYQYGD